MSDLKAAFRAAKEQRGTKTLTANQVKALKLQKASEKRAPESQAARVARPPVSQPNPGHEGKSDSPGVPSDFFEQPLKKRALETSSSHAPPLNAAAPAVKPGPSEALPEGFFEDKEADAKARGVKLPDAKQKEDEFQDFQRMMEEEMKTIATKEAEEAEEEAQDKESREAFEQRVRMERLKQVLTRGCDKPSTSEGAAHPSDPALIAEEALGLPRHASGHDAVVLPKKKRPIDSIKELMDMGEDAGSGDSEGDDSDKELLDWRAKTV